MRRANVQALRRHACNATSLSSSHAHMTWAGCVRLCTPALLETCACRPRRRCVCVCVCVCVRYTSQVPSASMSVFNTVAVIVLIYVYDAWFEPALKGTRFKMTLLRRQGESSAPLARTHLHKQHAYATWMYESGQPGVLWLCARHN